MKSVITSTLGILFIAILPGCAAVSSLPTMQYCSKVKYERVGVDVTVMAECKAPVGGSGL